MIWKTPYMGTGRDLIGRCSVGMTCFFRKLWLGVSVEVFSPLFLSGDYCYGPTAAAAGMPLLQQQCLVSASAARRVGE